MPGNLSDSHEESWPEPNYIDPSEQQWLPGTAAVLYAIATIAIILNIAVRITRGQTGSFGFDDGLLVLGWLAFTSLTVFVLLGATKYMMGRHMWDIPKHLYEHIAWTNYFAAISFLATQCFVKMSVLLFYRRLAQDTCARWWSCVCIVALIFTMAWTLGCALALAFACTPPAAYWKSYHPGYSSRFHCIDASVVNWLSGILPVISDLYSVLLPCLLLVKLRLPTVQKIGVYIIFLAGLSVVAVSSVRTYFTHQIDSTSDISSTLYLNFGLSQLEICLGCLCATAPSLRLLFRHHLKKPLNGFKQAVTEHISSLRRPSEAIQVPVPPEQPVICCPVIPALTLSDTEVGKAMTAELESLPWTYNDEFGRNVVIDRHRGGWLRDLDGEPLDCFAPPCDDG